MSSVPSITPAQVEQLLAGGSDSDEVARLLVATGAWTEEGAREIVSTLSPSRSPSQSGAHVESWPGPLKEVQPLFA